MTNKLAATFVGAFSLGMILCLGLALWILPPSASMGCEEDCNGQVIKWEDRDLCICESGHVYVWTEGWTPFGEDYDY